MKIVVTKNFDHEQRHDLAIETRVNRYEQPIRAEPVQ
jgi:hypothetical protein